MAHCNLKCWTVGANVIINDKTTHVLIDVIATTTRWALANMLTLIYTCSQQQKRTQCIAMTQTVILNSIFNSCEVDDGVCYVGAVSSE